jgi:hypothetical protein
MKQLLIKLLSIYLFMSCASHQGTISSTSIDKNVRYEDIAYGVAQTNKYFGIGGLSQDALVFEAKSMLIKNRPLQSNEEYLNFTVDFKTTYILFYCQTKVTMSADIVRLLNDSTGDPYSENYKNKLFMKGIQNELFSTGDSIMDYGTRKGTILSITDKGKARMLYKTKNNKIRTKNISVDDIYAINKTFKGYKSGDNYNVKITSASGPEQKTSGKIIALGLHALIILDDENHKTRLVDYNQ